MARKYFTKKDYTGVKPQKTPAGKFNTYRQNARKRGISFDLNFKDFENFISSPCYFCGGDGYGIDRVNNHLGYEVGNCVACCTLCNKMKSDIDLNLFIDQCVKINKHFK